MPNKKILYIINHMDWFWSHRAPLASGAQERGWRVDVAATGAADDKALQKQGYTGWPLPAVHGSIDVLKTIWTMYRLIRRTRPDLVHVMTLKYAFMAGLAVRFCPGVQVVHTIAGLGYLFSSQSLKARVLRVLIKPVLKAALCHKRARIIVQNPDDQAFLVKTGFARAERCYLIRSSGVDLAQFPYVPPPGTDTPLIIMPTRLVRDKGLSVFIQTADILKERGVPARLQIAGGVSTTNPAGVTHEEMEEMIRGSAAEWTGHVADMPFLYARASLIVYPSWYGEGVPKVLLEAAATGRAIITTDHRGCREAVDHGKTGYLVPVKNAEATADAVEALLKNHEMLVNMGKAARTKAETEFDVNLIVQQTLDVYPAPSS